MRKELCGFEPNLVVVGEGVGWEGRREETGGRRWKVGGRYDKQPARYLPRP